MANSPLRWPGGKYRLAKSLIALFPPHTTYVEVFGGAAHVLFRKPRSAVEVYNDIDGGLVNFFRVLQDEQQCAELAGKVKDALYARELFDEALSGLNDPGATDVERAFRFALVNKQSFGGIMETWGTEVTCCNTVSAWANLPNSLAQARKRFRYVQIEHADFAYILKRYDRLDTLFYCDPPYAYDSERTGRVLYDNEMNADDHKRLVDILLHVQGKVVLSGYDTPAYRPLTDAGWRKLALKEQVVNIGSNVNTTQAKRMECVWLSTAV